MPTIAVETPGTQTAKHSAVAVQSPSAGSRPRVRSRRDGLTLTPEGRAWFLDLGCQLAIRSPGRRPLLISCGSLLPRVALHAATATADALRRGQTPDLGQLPTYAEVDALHQLSHRSGGGLMGDPA